MKRFVISVASVLAIGIILPGLVLAQNSDVVNDSTTTTANDLPATTADDSVSTTNARLVSDRVSTDRAVDARTIAERTAERAANRAAITSAMETRVEAACTKATTLLASQVTLAADVRARREVAYTTVQQKLDDVIAAATGLEIDVTTLEAHADGLDVMVANFFANFDTYQQALDDTSTLDCETDAEGFYYAVLDAREAKQALRAESQVIKDFFQNDIRSALSALKDDFSSAREEQ